MTLCYRHAGTAPEQCEHLDIVLNGPLHLGTDGHQVGVRIAGALVVDWRGQGEERGEGRGKREGRTIFISYSSNPMTAHAHLNTHLRNRMAGSDIWFVW